MPKKLVIIVTKTWYHADAPCPKSKIIEFNDLKKAEAYYFEAERTEDYLSHTAIAIHEKEDQ